MYSIVDRGRRGNAAGIVSSVLQEESSLVIKRGGFCSCTGGVRYGDRVGWAKGLVLMLVELQC